MPQRRPCVRMMMALVLRAVDEDVFLVGALAPDGNLGKARYLIRSSLYAIRQEL